MYLSIFPNNGLLRLSADIPIYCCKIKTWVFFIEVMVNNVLPNLAINIDFVLPFETHNIPPFTLLRKGAVTLKQLDAERKASRQVAD